MPIPTTAVLDQLASAGLFVSVDGSWSFEALLGEQMCPDDDLDLVIYFNQVDAVIEGLTPLDYRLRFDETGFAHQQLPGARLFTCRIDALHARGMNSGHLDYEPDGIDRHEIGLLCEGFGLESPEMFAR